jgi:hypothetical protein
MNQESPQPEQHELGKRTGKKGFIERVLGLLRGKKPEEQRKSEFHNQNIEVVLVTRENPYTHNPHITYEIGRRINNWQFSAEGTPTGDHGYGHNPEAHHYIGKFLAEYFRLGKGARVLEIGPGQNENVAQGFADNGATIDLVDYNHGDGDTNTDIEKDNPPKRLKTSTENYNHYHGNFADALKPGSDLSELTGSLDFIMTNGAFVSEGYNFTADHLIEAQYANQAHVSVLRSDDENYQEFNRAKITEVIDTAKRLLKPGGIFHISSSRFAFHGAGFTPEGLAREKVHFLRYINIALEMGAAQITIFGSSAEEAKEQAKFDFDSEEGRALQIQLALTEIFTGFNSTMTFSIDNKRVGYDEIMNLVKDPDFIRDALNNPKVAQRVKEEIQRSRETAERVTTQLSGGLESIVDIPKEITTDEFQQIKTRLANIIPPSVGRIDSIAIKF